MRVIKVSDFSKFPGPRYKKLGKFSGEEFRESVLIPAINDGVDDLEINLDGVFGYGSSFLEEAFGGLVRAGFKADTMRKLISNISSKDPSLIVEIKGYVESQLNEVK